MEAAIRLQSLIDNHPQAAVVIDRNFRVVAVNKAFENTFHMTREAAVGQDCFRIAHNNTWPCFELGQDCPLVRFMKDESPRKRHTTHHTHQCAEGRTHRVEFDVFPLEDVDGNLYIGEVLAPSTTERPDSVVRLVGSSQALRRAIEELGVAAISQLPVLLAGETGTGKELAAQYIHKNSSRSGKPFLTLDCTVLSESLFESEVFGHTRGAFTDSIGDRKGLVALAEGGTLFLDEIGEMPPALQPKLLRLLDTGEYRRVGGTGAKRANVRIICATNQDLSEQKSFRRDLYYRIACTTITMPPLRERLEDIPELASALLDRIGASEGRSYQIESDALEPLQRYTFPGNVRELRNILWDTISRSHSHTLCAEFVLETLHVLQAESADDERLRIDPGQESGHNLIDFGQSRKLRDLERKQIGDALKRHRGNRRKAAVELGISERTLYRKIQKYQM